MNHCDLGFVGHVTTLGISVGKTRAVRYAIRDLHGDIEQITATNHSHFTEDDPNITCKNNSRFECFNNNLLEVN